MIQVREYALLTSDKSQSASIDLGIVSPETFTWLEELQQKWSGQAQLFRREGTQFLRLGSYVGYLQSPNGESIEILPKTELLAKTPPNELRQLLRRMLSASRGISPREVNQAALLRSQQPLHEWIFSEFLRHLTELVRRGLRFDYQFVEDEQSPFIRGQLNLTSQMRQPPGRDPRFHVRYAEFTPQRIENRLLRTVLNLVLHSTRDAHNWRQATTLSHHLESIEPVSGNASQFMSQWEDGKYLSAYKTIKPWSQLILENLNPDFQKGLHQGISLLFPMEKLYECYVGRSLALSLQSDYRMTLQSNQHSLLEHTPVSEQSMQQWFRLKPDFIVMGPEQPIVLDAKWKLLDSSEANSQNKYNISQADLYQMYAYGQKYLQGQGTLILIYPQHQFFTHPLPIFRFDAKLSLWCIPFNLQSECLVVGDWLEAISCFKENLPYR